MAGGFLNDLRKQKMGMFDTVTFHYRMRDGETES